MSTKRKTGKGAGQPLRLSKAPLDGLIEEALVDAYGESEQMTGFDDGEQPPIAFRDRDSRRDGDRGKDRYHRRRPTRRGVQERQDQATDFALGTATAFAASGRRRVDRRVSILANRQTITLSNGKVILYITASPIGNRRSTLSSASRLHPARPTQGRHPERRQNKMLENCVVCMYSHTYT